MKWFTGVVVAVVLVLTGSTVAIQQDSARQASSAGTANYPCC